MSRIKYLALPALALVSSCAKDKPVAAVAPPPAAAAIAVPMPRPPLNAAPTLTLPVAAADGSFATPNRDLSAPATLWHLRAALNVAVLQCARAGDPAEAHYNAFLKAHAKTLAGAHKALAGEYRAAHAAQAQDRFDDAMTRLYNFYAQPPARAAFCAAATPLIEAAAGTTADTLPAFADESLATLDRPFTDFYRAYAQYRVKLAAWQAGRTPTMLASAAPRLEVDRAILMADTSVTMRGVIRYAARQNAGAAPRDRFRPR